MDNKQAIRGCTHQNDIAPAFIKDINAQRCQTVKDGDIETIVSFSCLLPMNILVTNRSLSIYGISAL